MKHGKNLKTLKRLSSETGASVSFLKQLIKERKLTKFRINSGVYISMDEFELLAKPADENECVQEKS